MNQKIIVGLRIVSIVLTLLLIGAMFLPVWEITTTNTKATEEVAEETVAAANTVTAKELVEETVAAADAETAEKIIDEPVAAADTKTAAENVQTESAATDSEIKEPSVKTVSLAAFTWFPENYSELLQIFKGTDRESTAFSDYYQSGSLSADLAHTLFHDENNKKPASFRDLEGQDFLSHFLSVSAGLAFFGSAVLMMAFAAIALLLVLFDGPRSKSVYAYFMVLSGYIGLVFSINNPFVREGVSIFPLPMLLLVISALLLVSSCVVIIVHFLNRKANKRGSN
ncbi:MAG: hypothetical protein IKM36_02465 [Oscillospiraceae bacterium]|nr:hypothetical protein [Oscillospiraceae bacterium]MBR3849336.1 hypothetical protein [Oscillospiraceae bacterium]